MPAFAQKAGGLLTDAQIDILVRGIRSVGPSPTLSNTTSLRLMRPHSPATPRAASDVFTAFCSSCHGPDGRGARAIADSSYLALVSDQHLRTVIITGMPHLGMPDWRSHSKPLSDADVTRCRRLARRAAEPLSAQLNHRGGSQ